MIDAGGAQGDSSRVDQGLDAIASFAPRVRAAPTEETPFLIVAPLRRTAPLVFASPHSGRRYPAGLLARAKAPLASLRRSEDAFVDELFAGAAACGAAMICATLARAYVDLNREPCEIDPGMYLEPPPEFRGKALSARVQAGLGVIPRVCGDGSDIYGERIGFADAERRLQTVHAPYHAALEALLVETRSLFGQAVLIDCHSMPSSARGPGAPDIVLGDRYGEACDPAVTAHAEAALRRMGYRVARNAPFAGGHTTQTYGRPRDQIHALQIELNRGLYVNERTLARTAAFEQVRADMTRLAEALCAARFAETLG